MAKQTKLCFGSLLMEWIFPSHQHLYKTLVTIT
jgi:hypothetical protein